MSLTLFLVVNCCNSVCGFLLKFKLLLLWFRIVAFVLIHICPSEEDLKSHWMFNPLWWCTSSGVKANKPWLSSKALITDDKVS